MNSAVHAASQNCVLAAQSASCYSYTTASLYGFMEKNFVTRWTGDLDAPVCSNNRLKYFLGQVSKWSPILSCVSSARKRWIRFLFLSNNGPVQSLSTIIGTVAFEVNQTPWKFLLNLLRHFLKDFYRMHFSTINILFAALYYIYSNKQTSVPEWVWPHGSRNSWRDICQR
jgi:hypothetical protein